VFYEGEIRDGKRQVAGARLFAFYVSSHTGTVEPIDPAVIWDLAESTQEVSPEDIDALKAIVMPDIIPVLRGYKDELAVERERQAGIKEKYGLKSLNYLILELDGDLISLYERRANGENVDRLVRNKEDKKQDYEDSLKALELTIAQEGSLTPSTPNYLGAIRVIPALTENSAMKSDPEIERIGMEITIRHEREQGRIPEDVSAENLGFDVRSTDLSGVKRYIEVKARSGLGAVALTQNEWFKAKQFKSEYFLYVVLNAGTQPILYIIQNPAEETQPEEQIEVVRHLISLDEIQQKGVREHQGL